MTTDFHGCIGNTVRKPIPHKDEPLVNHADEGIRAAPPGVAVGDLFEEVRLFVEGLAADLDVHAEVRADRGGGGE